MIQVSLYFLGHWLLLKLKGVNFPFPPAVEMSRNPFDRNVEQVTDLLPQHRGRAYEVSQRRNW